VLFIVLLRFTVGYKCAAST